MEHREGLKRTNMHAHMRQHAFKTSLNTKTRTGKLRLQHTEGVFVFVLLLHISLHRKYLSVKSVENVIYLSCNGSQVKTKWAQISVSP